MFEIIWTAKNIHLKVIFTSFNVQFGAYVYGSISLNWFLGSYWCDPIGINSAIFWYDFIQIPAQIKVIHIPSTINVHQTIIYFLSNLIKYRISIVSNVNTIFRTLSRDWSAIQPVSGRPSACASLFVEIKQLRSSSSSATSHRVITTLWCTCVYTSFLCNYPMGYFACDIKSE